MTVPAAYDLRKFTFSHATATKYVTTAADLIDAIDALHQPWEEGHNWCAACDVPWPCSTALLLHPEEARHDR